MAEPDCGCQIGIRNTGMEAAYGIHYCPKHDAVDDLIAALEEPMRHIAPDDPWVVLPRAWINRAQDAIRKAEPGGDATD